MFTHCLLSGAFLIALVTVTSPVVSAQSAADNTVRERAKVPYDEGMAHVRNEAFDAALKAFQRAIDVDPSFDMAYYMLGRTHMAVRNYVSATLALSKCRDLYQADSTRQFTNKQERQRILRDRMRDLDQLIEDTQRAADLPANVTRRFSMLQDVRLYEEQKRQLQDMDRNDAMRSTTSVPAFVSLSLGSAYFRAGKLKEAEEAYLATVATDPKVGEAHNNLAVVYMETGRFDQAEKAVKAAEKTGLKVQKALKDEIEKRKKAGS